MGSTGLLPYVHGIDFSYNDFTDQTFQGRLGLLQSLRWVNLDNMRLCKLPNDLFKLLKLEYLSVANNQLLSIHGDLSNLKSLRSINFSRNRLKNYGIPSDLFSLKDLSVVDLSHNQLLTVPSNITDASSLLILNLSHNEISTIPREVFKHLIGLVYLNVGNNNLENVPPQLRRLLNLKVLILSGNPLSQSQLRQLAGLRSLRTLELRGTFRTDLNLPPKLSQLIHLTKIDLSHNELTKLPESLYDLSQLVHIDVSDNKINSLSANIEIFTNLQYLNLSRNNLTLLPSAIYRLPLLKTLYLAGNMLDQTGLPSGLHRLLSLINLNLASNNFASIPDSLFRCKRLKKLNLSDNQLKTLPVAFHRRKDIEIDFSFNPDLRLPPHPHVDQRRIDSTHGIDFSLSAQLMASGVLAPKPAEVKPTAKESINRRLKLLRKEEDESLQSQVLEGMKKNNIDSFFPEEIVNEPPKKRWDEHIERPNIDYSNIFSPDIGRQQGLVIFEMNEFYPVELNQNFYGNFFLGDCYVILETTLGDMGELSYEIFYIIGPQSSMDKRSAAAIHAVHLRNFLNTSSRTHREDMQDESDDLLDLFESSGLNVRYIDGQHALSGLYSSAADSYKSTTKCYLLQFGPRDPVAIPMPLNLRLIQESPGIYLIESDDVIYVYCSSGCSEFIVSKSRLIGENVSKHDHKSCPVVVIREGDQNEGFWDLFDRSELSEDINLDFKCKLYQVNFNNKFLELPQAAAGRGGLRREMLNSGNVYILDAISVIYVWKGIKSQMLLCNAGLKLSEELFIMIPRPKYSSIKFFKEGDETLFFKSCFKDWESLLSLGSLGRVWPVEPAEGQQMKNDISALFLPRRPDYSMEESESIILDYRDNCQLLIAYVFDRKKFVGLPKENYGHFRQDSCYLFICSCHEITEEEDVSYLAYFWEGLAAPVGGWIHFVLSLKPTIEHTLKTSLDVCRLEQQKEDLRFLSLFDRKFVIHNSDGTSTALFVLRSTIGMVSLRCVEVDVDARNLNSHTCSILVVPFEGGQVGGIVYVWIGNFVPPEEAEIAENIAHDYYGPRDFVISVVEEGCEPYDYFWSSFGEQNQEIEKEGYFLKNLRLFRGSSENNCFTVEEKCPDFSRNDLSDKSPMILDDGKFVFVWIPSIVNAMDVRLCLHSSSVYIKHLEKVEADKPRKLVLQRQNKESYNFKRCFHGWSI